MHYITPPILIDLSNRIFIQFFMNRFDSITPFQSYLMSDSDFCNYDIYMIKCLNPTEPLNSTRHRAILHQNIIIIIYFFIYLWILSSETH